MNIKKLRLWTALITPMNGDGSIDFKSLERIIQIQESAGNGILLLGSTGEGLALSDEEKKSVVSFVSELNPGTGVMAGVGGFNLENQKNWIEFCNQLNIDAFLLVSPLYSKPGPVGMEKWFGTLLDTAERPCMLYNIPGRTGIEIPPVVVKNLSGYRNMWSLKEASGSEIKFNEFRKSAPGVALYSGDDNLLPLLAKSGCIGLVSVASNVWPEATSRYVELSLAGDTSSFGNIWPTANKALFTVSNPIPAKVLLVEKGLISNSALRLPLIDQELGNKKILMDADKAISEWYLNHK
jgi:4-hydroxy-tetrahydrodipicolinate synthase